MLTECGCDHATTPDLPFGRVRVATEDGLGLTQHERDVPCGGAAARASVRTAWLLEPDLFDTTVSVGAPRHRDALASQTKTG